MEAINIMWVLFGVFTTLFTGYTLMFLIRTYTESLIRMSRDRNEAEMLIIKERNNIDLVKAKIEAQNEYDIADRPRPYLVKYFTIPTDTDDHEDHEDHEDQNIDLEEPNEDEGNPEMNVWTRVVFNQQIQEENNDNTVDLNNDPAQQVINGAGPLLMNMGISRATLFVSKPSELVKNLIKAAPVDWKNEVFHLISCEQIDSL